MKMEIVPAFYDLLARKSTSCRYWRELFWVSSFNRREMKTLWSMHPHFYTFISQPLEQVHRNKGAPSHTISLHSGCTFPGTAPP